MNKLENNNLIIETKSHGAELTRIYSKSTTQEFLWNANNKYWARHSPILFPIVGRLKDNETYINNTLYNMNQHGFARDMNFNLINSDFNSLTYKLKSDDTTKNYYPYDFELLIKYTIKNSSIHINWTVINKTDSEMYFSIGGHPAFNIPFNNIDKVDNYYLKFKSSNPVSSYKLDGPYVSSKSSINNLTDMSLSSDLFANDALIYDNVDSVSICSKNSSTSIELKFNNFPFVGIWSPYYKETNSIAPFICVEPWYGIADSIDSNKKYTSKLGINKLNKNEIFEASYEIKINI
ncbi:MAG: aldose 1-epimerase family protein [Terrisporobacter sp.]